MPSIALHWLLEKVRGAAPLRLLLVGVLFAFLGLSSEIAQGAEAFGGRYDEAAARAALETRRTGQPELLAPDADRDERWVSTEESSESESDTDGEANAPTSLGVSTTPQFRAGWRLPQPTPPSARSIHAPHLNVRRAPGAPRAPPTA